MANIIPTGISSSDNSIASLAFSLFSWISLRRKMSLCLETWMRYSNLRVEREGLGSWVLQKLRDEAKRDLFVSTVPPNAKA